MILTAEERAAIATVETLLRRLDIWAARYDGQDANAYQWELTTHERAPGQHWHGHGATLYQAIEDLVATKRAALQTALDEGDASPVAEDYSKERVLQRVGYRGPVAGSEDALDPLTPEERLQVELACVVRDLVMSVRHLYDIKQSMLPKTEPGRLGDADRLVLLFEIIERYLPAPK